MFKLLIDLRCILFLLRVYSLYNFAQRINLVTDLHSAVLHCFVLFVFLFLI